MTNFIYDYINGYANKIIIQDLNIEYKLEMNLNKKLNDFDDIIIENSKTKNQISIIKLINEEIILDNYYEIDSDINYSSEEIFIIDNNREKSIENKYFEDIEYNNFNIGTPIIIKKNSKSYLIGILNKNNNTYFSSNSSFIYL